MFIAPKYRRILKKFRREEPKKLSNVLSDAILQACDDVEHVIRSGGSFVGYDWGSINKEKESCTVCLAGCHLLANGKYGKNPIRGNVESAFTPSETCSGMSARLCDQLFALDMVRIGDWDSVFDYWFDSLTDKHRSAVRDLFVNVSDIPRPPETNQLRHVRPMLKALRKAAHIIRKHGL